MPIHECSPRCGGCKAEIDELRARVTALEMTVQLFHAIDKAVAASNEAKKEKSE